MWPDNYNYYTGPYRPYVPYRPAPKPVTVQPTTRITINKEKNKMTTVAQQRKAHEADILAISEKMRDLAKEHDFCEVFEEAVADLNRVLTMPIELHANKKGYADISIRIYFDSVPMDESYEEMDDDLYEEIQTNIEDAIKDVVSDYEDATLSRGNAIDVEYVRFVVTK